MKAIIWKKYGSPEVLELHKINKPVPKDSEVRIKIHAATVTAGDCEVRNLKFPLLLRFVMQLYIGFKKPKRIKILGQELAGEIDSVGKNVKLFKKGDAVFTPTGFRMGAYAEYLCMPEKEVLALKPVNMTYAEAACIPVGGLEAVHFLQKAEISRGSKVLIIGAGGSIGAVAVQLAKYYGAEVTAIDRGNKLDMLKSIGADYVIDYTQTEFTKNEKTYDVIFNIVGKGSYSSILKSLEPNGKYLLGNTGLSQILRGKWTSMTTHKTVITGTAAYNSTDLLFLKKLIENGSIRAVIDRYYPLEQIVDAHRYVDSGQKKGNIIITINDSST